MVNKDEYIVLRWFAVPSV